MLLDVHGAVDEDLPALVGGLGERHVLRHPVEHLLAEARQDLLRVVPAPDDLLQNRPEFVGVELLAPAVSVHRLHLLAPVGRVDVQLLSRFLAGPWPEKDEHILQPLEGVAAHVPGDAEPARPRQDVEATVGVAGFLAAHVPIEPVVPKDGEGVVLGVLPEAG